jgi:hypothetical protein
MFCQYTTPTKKDMAILLVFFNPANSIRIIQNLLTVKHSLERSAIPTYIAELAFEDQSFVFAPAENMLQVRSSSYMFYKENLIKALEPHIPATFTKLCMLDADIMFDTPAWYQHLSNQLDIVDVCQPFTKTVFLDIAFNPVYDRTNCVDSIVDLINWGKEHAGHVWAFRRDWYTGAEMPDETVIGGGDEMVIRSLKPIPLDKGRPYNFYKELIRVRTHRRASCPFTIYHLNHGTLSKRQYNTRQETIQEFMQLHSLTYITELLERRPDGIFEWKPEYRDSLNKIMLAYFKGRQDDGI